MQKIGRVTGLFTYPVKSLAGVETDKLELDEKGPVNDRKFMLVKPDGQFITQRSHPHLATFRCAPQAENKFVLSDGNEEIDFIFAPVMKPSLEARVWQDAVGSFEVSPDVSRWLSEKLDEDCKLVAAAQSTPRKKEKNGLPYLANFPDSAPVLMTNQKSLEDLYAIDERITMKHFRANIVTDLQTPWIEKGKSEVKIGNITFPLAYDCTRCKMINNNPESGRIEFKVLQGMAQKETPVVFGLRMVHRNEGTIKIDDEVYL